MYRIDLSVLPLLLFGMTVFQLDRMNIASALTGGFGKDIHIDQSTVNLGNQLMFLGIIVLEIPSNLILQKVSHQLLLITSLTWCLRSTQCTYARITTINTYQNTDRAR